MKDTKTIKDYIKFIVMDVDGTLTDGKIYIGNNGEHFKAFNIKDGYGIKDILPKHSITPVIITGRESRIVLNRCKELGIRTIHQGCSDKLKTLREVSNDQLNIVAFIGDDLPDLNTMKAVKNAGGLVGCPNDAVEDIKCVADFISSKKGGDGAVRDFIEWIVSCAV